MNEPSNAAILGYVLLALASLVGLGVGLKQLFKPAGAGNGNGTHDVTRREFEELKAYFHQAVHELREHFQEQAIQLAILQREHDSDRKGNEP